MKTTRSILILFLLSISFFGFSQFSIRYKAAIDTSRGKAMTRQCSRPQLKNVSGFWVLQKKHLEDLQQNFKNLCNLNAAAGFTQGCNPDYLTHFAYQCLGVIINGRRLIYINALLLNHQVAAGYRDIEQEYRTWKIIPVIVCDGGKSFWGVLFDPQTNSFKDLQFNRGKTEEGD